MNINEILKKVKEKYPEKYNAVITLEFYNDGSGNIIEDPMKSCMSKEVLFQFDNTKELIEHLKSKI